MEMWDVCERSWAESAGDPIDGVRECGVDSLANLKDASLPGFSGADWCQFVVRVSHE